MKLLREDILFCRKGI